MSIKKFTINRKNEYFVNEDNPVKKYYTRLI